MFIREEHRDNEELSGSSSRSLLMERSTLNHIKHGVTHVKGDQSGLKGDQSSLKRDQSSLKRDQSSLKGDQSSLKGDQSGLKRDQSSLKRDQNIFKDKILLDPERMPSSKGSASSTGWRTILPAPPSLQAPTPSPPSYKLKTPLLDQVM